MFIRSISPIIATILIIVITVAIAGIFYAFTSGVFDSLISSSSQQIQQQSQMVSFTISNVYCSNNIVYFNIYNNGNVPININNSVIIFTDNNGNTIPINGSNIICNNGNIIPSRSSSLCYILNNPCYYGAISYIESMNFVFSGVSYNYNILDYDKFNIIYIPDSNNYRITVYNTQNIPTPSPFQQQIAIYNGDINIGPNFAYVNNPTLFNQINPNGQNVMFFNPNNGQLYYSWYQGQFTYSGVTCHIWWIKLDNEIPANSNIIIYMHIGLNNTNYYQQYYPYVGVSPQVDPSRQYDNGKYVFIAYGYFNNTFDSWKAYNYSGSWVPVATRYGIEMLDSGNMGKLFGNKYQATYILPPNNGNIPLIPLIVEMVLWTTKGYAEPCSSINAANVIALFGNTNQQIRVSDIGSTPFDVVYVPKSSTFVYIEYGDTGGIGPFIILKSAVTNSILNQTFNTKWVGDLYQYLIVNSTYVQAGQISIYGVRGDEWIPLTILNMYNLYDGHRDYYQHHYAAYTTNYRYVVYARYSYTVYANINYNPFRYPTLQIGARGSCSNGSTSYGISNFIEWVVARAYPPNGVMPRIYID